MRTIAVENSNSLQVRDPAWISKKHLIHRLLEASSFRSIDLIPAYFYTTCNPQVQASKAHALFVCVARMFIIETYRIRKIQDKDLDDLKIEIKMAPLTGRVAEPEKQGDCFVGQMSKKIERQEEKDNS